MEERKEMKKLYRGIYSGLLQSYLKNGVSDGLLGVRKLANEMVGDITRKATSSVLDKRGMRLREDARFLVHLIITEMIVVPILQGREMKEVDLASRLGADLETVLKSVKADESREVSGREILRVVSSKGDELRVNWWRIWS